MKTEEVAHTKNDNKENAGVLYVGIDVSKGALDIDAGDLGARKVANTPAKVREALEAIGAEARGGRWHVCLESTGPYIGALVAECQALGVPYSILNPYKVKCFATSVVEAKTDAIDASVIRRRAEAKRPEPTPPTRKALARLDWLLLARESIMKSVVATRCVLETVKGEAAKPLEKALAYNGKRVAEYDALIAGAVLADADTAGLVGALSGVEGVGTPAAAKIAAWMPEIGTLGRRKAAALAGLAPHTRESGAWKGRSFIGGGRKPVRDALFMPATVAIRFNPEMKRLHARLMARGKPYKVALAAVMRRLLCRLDSVARDYRAKVNEKEAVT